VLGSPIATVGTHARRSQSSTVSRVRRADGGVDQSPVGGIAPLTFSPGGNTSWPCQADQRWQQTGGAEIGRTRSRRFPGTLRRGGPVKVGRQCQIAADAAARPHVQTHGSLNVATSSITAMGRMGNQPQPGPRCGPPLVGAVCATSRHMRRKSLRHSGNEECNVLAAASVSAPTNVSIIRGVNEVTARRSIERYAQHGTVAAGTVTELGSRRRPCDSPSKSGLFYAREWLPYSRQYDCYAV